MKINIICVGSLKEKSWVLASDEYIKRLSSFCQLEIMEVSESKLPVISQALEAESEAILKKISGYSFALCVEGTKITSKEFANKIQILPVDGISAVTFIIGSSHGLSETVKKKADFLLSLSDMTFPHQMARVILLEQIYRAYQINTGGKYHK